ncbi:hypothetical protein GCM10011365_13230 [Marinicella pacifica]|uniref:Uncharacterized protein n=1 Tax=Marinicella pacifica TaxID=1171543 RepID=A0A917FPH2_9GAMM|nr:hypothetical protein [Marinicella pacifica]GGF93344.1 hypothetical protein GCM10011365_13230 [Marinicella pacifica]
MKVGFEEKTYESYFNNELDSKSSVYFPPGQVLEGFFGFDSASYSKNSDLWEKLNYPFLPFSGVNLLDIARDLEAEIGHLIDKIPNIKSNLLIQYKRPEYMEKPNSKEWQYWQKEYYRYQIYLKQQSILSKIDKSFGNRALVIYASPAINNIEELVSLKIKGEIIDNSNFKKASDLNNHSLNTYTCAGNYSIAFSEPEKLENIDLISELQKIEDSYYLDNKKWILNTSEVIAKNMKNVKSFNDLMDEYIKFKEFSFIYSLLTMKVFREITGVQWVLNIHT